MTDIFWCEDQFTLALYCVGGPCFKKEKESFFVFCFCFCFFFVCLFVCLFEADSSVWVCIRCFISIQLVTKSDGLVIEKFPFRVLA